MGRPVVIATNGIGYPVRVVDDYAPLIVEASNGIGEPIVLSDLGQPFILQLADDFTPASVFRAEDDGTVVDPSEGGSSQDAAGTTPAEEGDPVGRCEDHSGNGNPALQAVDLSRPTLGFDGRLYLDLSGVGVSLGLTLPALGTDVTVAYAGDGAAVILTGQTVSGAVVLPSLARLRVWMVINRALTAIETLRLTRYLNSLI